MKSSPLPSVFVLSIVLCTSMAGPGFGMISVGVLTKEKARDKYGITMHARHNGDAGIKVWLAFRQEGWLEKFTYAQFRMEDGKGNHLVSAQLHPNPVHHRQSSDITTVAFSADPNCLAQCSFLVVCYGSNEGDVGYYLKVKDFLDLADKAEDEATELSNREKVALAQAAAAAEAAEALLLQQSRKPVPVYTLDEILEALRDRRSRYQARAIRLDYTRRVNDVVGRPARTEKAVLVTQWNNFHEEAQDDKGQRFSRRLIQGVRVADGLPGGPGGQFRYLAHDTAHNIESTVWPHIHGPDAWFVHYLREVDKAGNLTIDVARMGLADPGTGEDVHSVSLTAGGHRLTLVPQWDWSITEYLGVMAQGYEKRGELWFPRHIRLHKTLKDMQGGWTGFRDEIELHSVDTDAKIPEDFMEMPSPKPGDRVTVAYAKWDPQWQTATVEPRAIRDSLRYEHSFIWSGKLNTRDGRIWQASLPWRNSGLVQRSLQPRTGEAFGYNDVGGPLPFVSRDGDRVIWAIYDAAARLMRPVDRLPERTTVNRGSFNFEAGFIPEKDEIMAGEAIYVTFYVKNTGDRTIYLETGGDGRSIRSYRFQLSATNQLGAVVRDPHPNPSHHGGPQGLPPEIRPGGTYSEKLQLAKWLSFDQPGQYTVRCARTLQFPGKQAFTQDYALIHPLATSFRLKVAPKTDQGLSARMSELGQRLRGEEDENNARLTAQLLADTGDKRIVDDLLWAAEKWSGDSWALHHLARFMDDPRVMTVFRSALHASRGNSRRSHGAQMMGDSGRRAFIPDLLESFGKEQDKFVLTSVATALGTFADPQAIPVLKTRRDHPYARLRLAVEQSLVQCGDALDAVRFQAIIRGTDATWHSAATFVSKHAGASAFRILAECLNFDRPEPELGQGHSDSHPAYRNGTLIMYIAQAGGPSMPYHQVHNRPATEQEIADNRQTLDEIRTRLKRTP